MNKQLSELIEWIEGKRKNLDDPMYSGYILNMAYKRIIEKAKSLQSEDGWIQVSERTPICYKEGEWDGKKSDEVLIQNKDGRYTIAVLYEGFLDGSHFKNWYGQDDWELEVPIKWKEIE